MPLQICIIVGQRRHIANCYVRKIYKNPVPLIRSNVHSLERHRNSLALGQMLNARGKFGNFGFDEAFDREEYNTRNAY
jgi:hypothetical protein